MFNSGYQANVGIIATLVEKDDLVLSDQLNHASIIDGCRLSRAAVSVYRHGDMDHLESLLKDAPANARKLIVTESIFSMDGDIAPLREMVELAERYDAMVMVDEAHATGVRGPNGAGVVAELGLGDRVLVQMGTLGKGPGSLRRLCGRQRQTEGAAHQPRAQLHLHDVAAAGGAGHGRRGRRSGGEGTGAAMCVAAQHRTAPRTAFRGWAIR